MEFWQLAAFFTVWFLTLVGVYWWGYVTGYAATNETITSIVDQRIAEIAQLTRDDPRRTPQPAAPRGGGRYA